MRVKRVPESTRSVPENATENLEGTEEPSNVTVTVEPLTVYLQATTSVVSLPSKPLTMVCRRVREQLPPASNCQRTSRISVSPLESGSELRLRHVPTSALCVLPPDPVPPPVPPLLPVVPTPTTRIPLSHATVSAAINARP